MEDESKKRMGDYSFGHSDTDLLYSYATSEVPVDKHSLIYSDPVLSKNIPDFAQHSSAANEAASSSMPPSHTPSTATLQANQSTDRLPHPPGTTRLRSEMEIRNQHYQRQKQYAAENRTRRLTDIDFEGILNLIGGCSRWQIFIYLIISAQQVPHAMFNLSVVYMMYQPDHWCKIPHYNSELFSAEGGFNYTWQNVLDSEVVFPKTFNKQRAKEHHDQCHYYKRNYVHLKMLDWETVKNFSHERVPVDRCTEWEYDKSVMEKTVVTEWNRVCDNNWSRAHVHMSYSLGYLLGCFVGGFVSDRYGRKTTIYAFGWLSLIFGFLLTYSREFEIFLVVRFLLAASNEAADLAAYVLCMEITGVKYRSIVGSLLQAPWACGYAFLALIAYLTKTWTAMHMVTVILHFFAMILIHFLPESPRWLILMNRVKPAEKIIRRACQMNKSRLPSDLGLIRHAEKRKWMKKDERPSYFHLFRSSTLRLRNCVLFVIWIATALVYYGLVIALSDQSSPGRSVFDGNFFLNNAIAGAIELPTLVLCVFLLKMGRKRSQMITLFGAGILILIAVYMSKEKRTTMALVFMFLGKACIQGSFNILYIFTSELNPTIVRNTAVGISSMVARMGSGASGYIAILSDVTLPLVPMVIFALFSLMAGVLVMCLPETQGLPLPETIWDAVNLKKGKPFNLNNRDKDDAFLNDTDEEDEAAAAGKSKGSEQKSSEQDGTTAATVEKSPPVLPTVDEASSDIEMEGLTKPGAKSEPKKNDEKPRPKKFFEVTKV